MTATSTYEKYPAVQTTPGPEGSWRGWRTILDRLRSEVSRGARQISIECYPGVFEEDIERVILDAIPFSKVYRARDVYKSPDEIDRIVERDLTDDPVFGRISGMVIEDFFENHRLTKVRNEIAEARNEPVLIIGTGATLLEPHPGVLVYADLPRWEIQGRQRSKRIGNLGVNNRNDNPAPKYKRAFFLDWRVADRIKRGLLHRIDFLLDTSRPEDPKLLTGSDFRRALAHTITRPFRLKPFFDPGPWGGQWMRRVCDLDRDAPNFAWCFDCVPEENSLLFDFAGTVVEVPAIDLVFQHPRELLGEAVHARFGTEFPIRFDFLDTMEGGNLSLQIHPLTEYIQDKFGMAYTQDESYYMLDVGPDAAVYLGLKQRVDRQQMIGDLYEAQRGNAPFDVDKYVNRWQASKHDHFLIPAGTVHCSGRNTMVLEISATPYIFTFKMWDWDRLGLDGKPRPIHLDHGISNIQWDRDTKWVRQNLINRFRLLGSGPGWTEERTGLHEREFIETRRYSFAAPVTHNTDRGVHVLNLVDGNAAVIESPAGNFEPFTVHYAETFVVPAAVGEYSIRPVLPKTECKTIRASVRTGPS